ncbi:mucin-5AC [Danio aesculapii]|uniref:mucin-5AC n=1 Tax=Danio aesculapii TaxID=1142201 RepID=UPI0024BF3764|nr:mucin-5AC [Danio aesculapii]
MGRTTRIVIWMLEWIVLYFGLSASQTGIFPLHNKQVCSTWGNYHFKKFDGHFIHLASTCNFLMSATCGSNQKDFYIQLRRQVENDQPTITNITMKLRSIIVELNKTTVHVNGSPMDLPFSHSGVLIYKSSSYITITATLGLVAKWNEDDSFTVELDMRYQNKTCGLCGDFSGNRSHNEFPKYDDRSDYGDFVKMNSSTDSCMEQVNSTKACKNMTSVCEQLLLGPSVSSCQDLVPLDSFIKACELDMCDCNNRTTSFCICRTISEYSSQCIQAGGKPEPWWTKQFCGYLFDDLTNRGCIAENECGCIHDGKIYEHGETYRSNCEECCTSATYRAQNKEFRVSDGGYQILHRDEGVDIPYQILVRGIYIVLDASNGLTVMWDQKKNMFIKLNPNFKGSVCGLCGNYDGNSNNDFMLRNREVETNPLNFQLMHKPAMMLEIVLPGEHPNYAHCSVIITTLLVNVSGITNLVELPAYRHAEIQMDSCYPKCPSEYPYFDDDSMKCVKREQCGCFDKHGDYYSNQDPVPSTENCQIWNSAMKLSMQSWPKRLLTSQWDYDIGKCNDYIGIFPLHNKQVCSTWGNYHFKKFDGHFIHLASTCNFLMSATCGSNQKDFYIQLRRQVENDQPTITNITMKLRSITVELNKTTVNVNGSPMDLPFSHSGVLIYKSSSYITITATLGLVAKWNEDDSFTTSVCEQLLLGPSVSSCQDLVPLDPFIKACELDMCDCNNRTTSFCICRTISEYSSQCIQAGGKPEPWWTKQFCGYLFDDLTNRGCIAENECGCIHDGKIYEHGETYRSNCEECTCEDRGWQCTTNLCHGTCSVYGDGHYFTFDGKQYTFSGDCEYTLVGDFCSHANANSTFRVLSENIPCDFIGTTCSKAIRLLLGNKEFRVSDGGYQILHRDEGVDIPYQILVRGIYIVLDASNGLTVMWDQKKNMFIKLNPNFKGSVCGLCGNYDGNSNNDFMLRNREVETNPLNFVSDWKESSICSVATEMKNPCSSNPYRQSWAQKQCSIIRSEVFTACHSHVDPDPFYDACVRDSCGCVSGGDRDCLCGAIAAYAQACNDAGTCVAWRTPKLCPLFCDYYNPSGECEWHYKPCGAPCIQTCRNPDGQCSNQILSLEGCYPKCPSEYPYFDEDSMKCVKREQCGCFDKHGDYYSNQDPVPSTENCQIWWNVYTTNYKINKFYFFQYYQHIKTFNKNITNIHNIGNRNFYF